MMLRFLDVTKRFDDSKTAVDGVSLNVPRSEFCVILGASGAGKSTLLRMVNGLLEPTAGVVEFDGTTVSRSTLKQLRPRVGMIHQQFNLVNRLSVLKNVLAGTLPRVSTLRSLAGWFPLEYRRHACQLLNEVGLLEEHLYRRAAQLSGGEQQRVAIARAFMLEPDVVLADEPVASLDPQTSRLVLERLRSASRQRGTTVLCSLHQVDLAKEFADRIIAMRSGQVVFDGEPDSLEESILSSVYDSKRQADE